MSQAERQRKVHKNWVLLDIQSTVHLFFNRHLLTNIRKAERELKIHSTAGTSQTDDEGDLPGFGTVWLYKNGIANILSLALVRKRFRVTYDSDTNEFYVHKPDGGTHIFKQSERGLYYTVMGDDPHSVFVNTVEDNKNMYSSRDYSCAIAA
eukprot:11648703-Ditylum_brightwellii.AAC.1